MHSNERHTMQPRTLQLRMPDERIVTMTEPTIETVEAIAVEFPSEETQTPIGQRRFTLAVIAAAITHINGKPVSQVDFNPRKEWPLLRHWDRLEKAFNRLLDITDHFERATLAARESKNTPQTACHFKLPSGRTVDMQALALDQDQLLLGEARYSPREWYRLVVDRSASAIVAIDGNDILRQTFNPRVEFPLYADWLVIQSVFNILTVEEEDLERFLHIPASHDSMKSAHGSQDTDTNN